jgi:hypothetical protein
MPSPYLERGDMAIIVLPAIALTTFDKEKDEKSENSRGNGILPAQFFQRLVRSVAKDMSVAVRRMLAALRFTIKASPLANWNQFCCTGRSVHKRPLLRYKVFRFIPTSICFTSHNLLTCEFTSLALSYRPRLPSNRAPPLQFATTTPPLAGSTLTTLAFTT